MEDAVILIGVGLLERQSRDGRPGTVVQSSAFSKFDAVHNAGFENDHFQGRSLGVDGNIRIGFGMFRCSVCIVFPDTIRCIRVFR